MIEAHYLFGADYDHIDIVIHPQSIIHSMIETQVYTSYYIVLVPAFCYSYIQILMYGE